MDAPANVSEGVSTGAARFCAGTVSSKSMQQHRILLEFQQGLQDIHTGYQMKLVFNQRTQTIHTKKVFMLFHHNSLYLFYGLGYAIHNESI